MAEARDHWVCPECGCGVCVAAGELPDDPFHWILTGIRYKEIGDNKIMGESVFAICGEYEYEGSCPDVD